MTDPRIAQFLQETGLAAFAPVVTALSGDASDRRYFRVAIPGQGSQILALYPGPITFEQMPFVNVCRLFADMPVPVPQLLAHSNPLGIVAQQDLGDVTLQAHLESADPAERRRRYREALAIVDMMQRRGAELASPNYIPYGLAFDIDKLSFELNFFVMHFIEAHRQATLTAADRDALATEFKPVVDELASEQRVVCHRDYHSRNLMVWDGRLTVIDFQDARMGPDTYDVASLLRDSYVDFDEAEVDSLLADFQALRRTRPGVGGGADDDREFRRRFDLMSLQRNLKALGTFGFQATSRGNAAYLASVPRTLAHVRRNLERYPRFKRLRRLLAAHLPELR